MSAFEFTLMKQSGGRLNYAKVRLDAVTGADGYEFVWAAGSDVPPELAAAADSGARFAWKHQRAVDRSVGVRVRIDELDFSAKETSPHGVAYATCYAVWGALKIEGDTELHLGEIDLDAPDV